MELETIIAMITIIPVALGSFIASVKIMCDKMKCEQDKKKSESINAITNEIIPKIREAEKFKNFSGSEKKAYVMNHAMIYAIRNNLKVDPEFISLKIDKIVCLTNFVNSNKEVL